MSNKLFTVNVQGAPYECGKAYGVAAAVLIKKNIDVYSSLYLHYSGLDKQKAIDYSFQYENAIRDYCPSILEEMKGIADGAGVPFGEILMINARTELLALNQNILKECTVIGATFPATTKKDVWLAQNWDWLYSTRGTTMLYRVKQPKMPSIMMYVEAGHVGKLGFNETGIGLCHNWLESGKYKFGIPFIILCRLILMQSTMKDAIDLIYGVERASSGNFMLAHKSGVVIDFETSPHDISFLEPEKGILVHTNHFISERLKPSDLGLRKNGGDSLIRMQTAKTLLSRINGNVGKSTLIEILRDRSCGDYSICTLPSNSEDEYERWGSLASVIMNVNNLEMYIAHGLPHKSNYEKAHLS